MYKYKVFIEKVKCRDTESIHTSDKLIIAGVVATNKENKGYALPLIRINTNEERYPNTLIFEGLGDTPFISIALQATDIDENDGWYENKDNIIKMASEIGQQAATYLSSSPQAGEVTGDGIKKLLPIIGGVITFFTKKDNNDILGQFSAVARFDNLVLGEKQIKPLSINFNEHDDYISIWPFGSVYVDYNDFTYDFDLRIECEKIGNDTNLKWEKVDGLLKQISVANDGSIWGINSGDYIYKWNGVNWTQVGGNLKNISVAVDGTVWGVNAADNIFKYNPQAGWEQVDGALKQISVAYNGSVWGVNRNDDIFYRSGSTWIQVAGKLNWVSAAADGTVWGVNSADEIFRLVRQ